MHRPVLGELMAACGEETKRHIHTILEYEKFPFTQNGHYFQECRDKWLSKYKDARAGKRPAERVTPTSAQEISSDTPVVASSVGM